MEDENGIGKLYVSKFEQILMIVDQLSVYILREVEKMVDIKRCTRCVCFGDCCP